MKSRTAAALVSLAVGVPLAAQVVLPAQNQPPTFRAGVEYVEVDARVVDRGNEPVAGLAQRDFQVFEDGVKQDVVTFSAATVVAAGSSAPAARRSRRRTRSDRTSCP